MAQRALTISLAIWAVVTLGVALVLPGLTTYDLAGEVPDADTDKLLAWCLPAIAVAILPGLVLGAVLARRSAIGIVHDARHRPSRRDPTRVGTPVPHGGWWRWVVPVVGGVLTLLFIRSVVDQQLTSREALVLGMLLVLFQVAVALLVVLLGFFVGTPLLMVVLAVTQRSVLDSRATKAVVALAAMILLIMVVAIAVSVAPTRVSTGGTPRSDALARMIDVLFLAPATTPVVAARASTVLLLVSLVYGIWHLRPDGADTRTVSARREEP